MSYLIFTYNLLIYQKNKDSKSSRRYKTNESFSSRVIIGVRTTAFASGLYNVCIAVGIIA